MTTATAEIDWTQLRAVTNDAFYTAYGNRSRNLVLWGGAGSGKSAFAATKCAIRCMQAREHVGGFRKVARTLRTSVCAEFADALDRLGVRTLWTLNKTDLVWECVNGSVFRCLGLDDVDKLKSIKSLTSTWIEEATECVPLDYEQINLRMRGRSPSYKQHIITFNPVSVHHWIKKRLFDTPQHGRTTTLHSTYKDNRFLDDEYAQELELLAERDSNYGTVYARGKWGVLQGVIYDPFIQADWPPREQFSSTAFGIDWGYNDPMVLVQADIHDSEPYLTELFYQTGKTTADLVQFMKSKGLPKNAPYICDSAEPDRIEELRRAGFNAQPADKRQGSLKAGIDFCKKLKIHTRPENENLNAENVTYRWRVDKDGNTLDEPEDANNHAMDAMRYVLHKVLRRPDTPRDLRKQMGM